MAKQPQTGFLTQADLAERWSVSVPTLHRLRKLHPLYRPVRIGFPGPQGSSGRTVLYHRRQVELLDAVFVRALDIETAWKRWQAIRDRMADAGKQPERPAPEPATAAV